MLATIGDRKRGCMLPCSCMSRMPNMPVACRTACRHSRTSWPPHVHTGFTWTAICEGMLQAALGALRASVCHLCETSCTGRSFLLAYLLAL